MGDGDGVNAPKTRRGRIAATAKKIIVLNNSTQADLFNIFSQERKRFESEIKKIEAKLKKVLETGEALIAENEKLQAEVNKIHNRWEILDFS